MTTHIFIVNSTTFKYHLEYMFAGTGAKDNIIDFNNNVKSSLHHTTEINLVKLMADCCRVKIGDQVIFYLQKKENEEGKFYGIFQVDSEPFIDNNDSNQFLKKELNKSLTFRVKIKPLEVYSQGVSEWNALDDISQISAPNQMLWSLIYRKLKGNRGNTMITLYEAERLLNLIRKENNYNSLNYENYTFNKVKIESTKDKYDYTGKREKINILPRLSEKYKKKNAHEAHLQAYILQNIGTNENLNIALDIKNDNIEWIGNEVSCGVGMQQIDIMISSNKSNSEKTIMPIELKSTTATANIIKQLKRYILWIEQYYIPNKPSTIQPVVICKAHIKKTKNIIHAFKEFHKFNKEAEKRYLPLKYIEYSIIDGQIFFEPKNY